MANIDEAFAALSDVQSVSVNENVDFVVDSYLRVISIPVRGVVLGVEGDKDVNRVTFRMSRTYKGVDMSQFQIRINYANANNELNYFKVTEITVSDDEIVFVWVVGADAVAYVGNVEFVVRFIKLSGSNIIQELNTTLATAKSLIGLSVDGEISPVQREDLLAHFYNEIDAYSETKKNEILDSIPEDYTALANEVDELKGDLAQQTFYKKQNNDDNIVIGINGTGTITSDKNCTVVTSNKNLAIVTNSFSTDVQYGSPIQIDRRNIKAGKRYYVSFNTQNTGCECQVYFDYGEVKRFTCDGTRKQLDVLCSEHNNGKNVGLIWVRVGGTQSGIFTDVQIEEEKFTNYVPHVGEDIEIAADVASGFNVYNGYTSIWISDDTANIDITYPINGVNYTDSEIERVTDMFPNLKGKKVVTYGDSLFASGNDTNDYSWQKVLCDSLGIENHIGVSIGGSGYCWNESRRYDYPSDFKLGDNLPVGCFINSTGANNANFCSWDRISKTIPKDADVVIIGTGTNDLGSLSLDLTFKTSDIQDTDWLASSEYEKYGGDFRTGGIRGAIMSTIMKIHCQAPNADIYLTNWCNSRGDNGTNNQPNTSRETETMTILDDIEYVAKNAGVPLIDLFHNSGINPLNRTEYVIDIIHLNTNGYKKMGNYISAFLKSLIN